MNQNISRRDEILLEAVRSAEETALQLRSYAAATMRVPNECTYESELPYLPVQVEVTLEGWALAVLPVILPRRTDGDRSRFLASSLWSAVRTHFRDKPLPKFHSCVLVYEHIYAFDRKRRFTDHDNLELKHCQDGWRRPFSPTIPPVSAPLFSAVILGKQRGPTSGSCRRSSFLFGWKSTKPAGQIPRKSEGDGQKNTLKSTPKSTFLSVQIFGVSLGVEKQCLQGFAGFQMNAGGIALVSDLCAIEMRQSV